MSTIPRRPWSPKLAVFWFVSSEENRSRLVSLRWPFDINNARALQCIPYGHEPAWADVQRADTTLSGHPFDFFPRGRLEYFPPTRRWIFSVDPLLEAGCFIKYLVNNWELPMGHVTVEVEPSYCSSMPVQRP